MLGLGVGTAGGMKGLNSGWQVWGGNSTAPKRNASASSAPGGVDASAADATFGTTIAGTWRSSSGSWEEAGGSPQKREVGSLEPLSLHHARQRQVSSGQATAFSTPRMDERSGAAKPAFSPQRYDTSLNKDSQTPIRFPSSVSPKSGGFAASSAFGQPTHQNPNLAYEPMTPSSVVENELSLGIRGMAVEDEYSAPHSTAPYRAQAPASQQASSVPTAPSIRVPSNMQQPRGPYNAYSPSDYAAYYQGPPSVREPYVDYSYPYDAYRATPDPAVYAASTVSAGTSPASLYPSAGLYYDYSGPARPPGSQYFYPSQPMVYGPPSHSPMMTPQLAVHIPPSLNDKKRELQVG
ncbi:hypothetical protein FA95DRAFT_1480124 [Auriscalpium vulgare]|uniref:Uncharacterized protein n=1 Tax=Auriscalpium vulgare TaxID=40419 RepID=A0ACB8SCA5_9AGAM|nr:hypothetical protein FA95DRAFT_1480124 [Auriscalpium vulgare]